MIKEEVKFSRTNVTSLDWEGYGVLRFTEAPEVTGIVVNRPDIPPSGAGEEALAAVRRRSRTRSSTPPECGCTRTR